MAEKITVIIVDDIAETRENIRKLLQFDPEIEVVGVARTGTEAIEIASQYEPDVILMDINMPDMDGIKATEIIRGKIPFSQIIILSVQSDSNYMRRAMLAGARDFLTKPPNIDELTGAIHRAGEMAKVEREKIVNIPIPGLPKPGSGQLGGTANGRIISVYSPKGGVGVTTVTANTAVAIKDNSNTVAVMDANFQYGDLSFFFNEQGRMNITHLSANPGELDVEMIKEVMIEHKGSGVQILAAPPRPEQADEVNVNALTFILPMLKSMYDYVLVDMANVLNDATLSILDQSDLVVLITTQDIPSIKNVRLFLDLLTQLGIGMDKVMLVMNSYDKRRSITPERVSENFKQEFAAVIPLEMRTAIPAMDRGEPFMISNRAEPMAKAVEQLSVKIKKYVKEMEEFD